MPIAPPIIFLATTPLIGGLVVVPTAKMLLIVAIAFTVGIWLACALAVVISRTNPTVARRLFVSSVLSSILNLAGIAVSLVAVIGLLTVFAASFLISLPILICATWNRATVGSY